MAEKVQFTLHGADKVIKNIEAAGEKGKEAARNGIEQFADHVFARSSEIVPFDTGQLAKGIIDEPIKDGVKVIGYSALSKDGYDYAARQHEDLSLNHPGEQSVSPARGAKGQAKYLEQPLHEEQEMLLRFVGNEIKKIL